MFSVLAQARMSLAALPPAPIDAIFSFSSGDLYPSMRRDRVLPNPPAGTAPASSEPKKKCRRLNLASDIQFPPVKPDSKLGAANQYKAYRTWAGGEAEGYRKRAEGEWESGRASSDRLG